MFDPYRKRREKAARIREMRMGAVDFSLPVDGDVPSYRPPASRAGDFMDSLVEDLVRDRSPFFDEVAQKWKGLFPDLPARPGKWVSGATQKSPGKLFLEVKSSPALFSMRPKLPAIKRQLAALPSAPERFSVHLEIARPRV
jgi:hypothetical protein